MGNSEAKPSSSSAVAPPSLMVGFGSGPRASPTAASDGAATPSPMNPMAGFGAKPRVSPAASDAAELPSLTTPMGGSAGANPRVSPTASDGAATPNMTNPMGGFGAKARASPTASDGAAPPTLTNPMGGNSPTALSSSSTNLAAGSGTAETTKPDQYPRRPGVADCSYYIKFGTCAYPMVGFGAKPRVSPTASDAAALPSVTTPMGGSAGDKPSASPTASDGAAPPSPTTPMGSSAGAKPRASPTAPSSSSDGPCSTTNLAASSGTGETTTKPDQYPRRPGLADCSYYVKFGTCAYGMKCWYHHPDPHTKAAAAGRQSQASKPSEYSNKHPHLHTRAAAGGRQSQASNPSEHSNKHPDLHTRAAGGQASNPSEHNNKQHLSGKACNYNRHEGKNEVEQVQMNFLGLPLRPGAGLCSYYMDRGTCKFGTNCKFHHPDPKSEPVNSNASRRVVKKSSQLNFSSKPNQRAQNEQSLPLVTSPTSGTSKIIPTHGDSTCTEQSAYKMDENKQGKTDWDTFATKVFCDICTDEVLAGNRPTDHLNAIGYNNLYAKFNEKTKKGYSHEQFKSKWDSLKKDYQTWKALMESGDHQGQGPKMDAISASPEWWAKKMEVMPDCGKFRSTPLENVELLITMFEDTLDSTSSTTSEARLAVSTTMESEHGDGDGNDTGIIDKEVDETMLEKHSNEEPNSTKSKTSCVHAELIHPVNPDENVNPRNYATSTRADRVGSNISEVMELVVDAGVEEGSDEHFIATQLFVRPEYREMFLTLKTPRGRLGWLKKMCQVKE